MSEITLYLNEYGTEVSSSEALKLKTFYKKILNGSDELRWEVYRKGILVKTSYYISSHSEIQAILVLNPDASFSLKTLADNYHVTESLSYENGSRAGKSITVKDIRIDKIICHQPYDILTDQPIHTATDKFYYENGLDKYQFNYSADGSCFEIQQEEYQEDFYAHNIGKDPDITFTWTGFEYYQFSDPYLPILTT